MILKMPLKTSSKLITNTQLSILGSAEAHKVCHALLTSYLYSLLLTPPFSAVLSPTFTFLIDEQRIPITIHIDMIRGTSEPLTAIMNNSIITESRGWRFWSMLKLKFS